MNGLDRKYGRPHRMTFTKGAKPLWTVFLVNVIRRTEKGVLVQRGARPQVWLPLAKVRLSAGGSGLMQIAVPAWLLSAKPELAA